MKTRYLVSILSDHLIPNYLFIKEMQGKYDKLVFITTIEMKSRGKGELLAATLHTSLDDLLFIEVPNDDYHGSIQRLELVTIFEKEADFILNLTGGTKAMALAVHDFFKQFSCQAFYIPIGKNTICSLDSSQRLDLNYRIDLEEYFSLYGLRFERDELLDVDVSPYDVFRKMKQVNFNRSRVDDIYLAQSKEDPIERRFFGGIWFEEYCYYRLKKERKLTDKYIAIGAKIYGAGSEKNDNEIDVMFMENNRLNIVECKVSLMGNRGEGGFKPTIEKSMYKLAAVTKDFGLIVNPYIFTLHRIKNSYKITDESKKNIEKRMRILGIKGILDCDDFTKDKLLI